MPGTSIARLRKAMNNVTDEPRFEPQPPEYAAMGPEFDTN